MKHITNNWIRITDDLLPVKSEEIDLTRPFYRYMSEESFKYIMNGSFMFKNPSKWSDPFEKLFVNSDYSKIGYNKPATYAACFTQLDNSEAHWKMYSNENTTSIRVEFDMMNLIGAFCLAEVFEKQSKIFIGKVTYDFTESSIRNLGTTGKYHRVAFPLTFGDNNYADLLLIKRPAYKWEEECRIIILNERCQYDSICMKFDQSMAKSFIRSIMICPPYNENDKSNGDKKYKRLKNSIEKWWNGLPHCLYENQLQISKATLYDQIEPIIIKR